MKQRARLIVSNIKFALFGSRMNFFPGFLNILYMGIFYVKNRNHTNPELVRKKVTSFCENGFMLFENCISSEEFESISQKVDRLFSDSKNVVDSLKDSGILRLKNSFVEVPELEKYFDNSGVAKTIESYYGGDFKIYSCDIYRTISSNLDMTNTENYSLMWHCDNGPNQMVKVFIYLTNVTRDSGATSFIPSCISRDFIVDYFDRFRQKDMWVKFEKYEKRIEATAGSLVLFRPQHCLHKANNPVATSYRDMAVFLLHPSLKKRKMATLNNRIQCSRNFGYLYNPFTSKTLRIDDQ